jgi:hypothetical protein
MLYQWFLVHGFISVQEQSNKMRINSNTDTRARACAGPRNACDELEGIVIWMFSGSHGNCSSMVASVVACEL